VVLLTVGSLALGAARISFVVALAVVALTYGVSGAVLAGRRPSNPIGWIMTAIGLSESTLVIGAAYVVLTQDRWPSAPFQEIAAWTGNWLWVPGLGAILTFLLLLFPDGHPPSPRWRWVMWVAGAGMLVGTVGWAVGLWWARWLILAHPDRTDVAPKGFAGVAGLVGVILLFGVAGIASIVSVVVRWRRAVGDERQQLRLFLWAAAVTGVGFLVALPSSSQLLLVVGILLLPISIAIAVMKYRLYDIDLVISKTVVYATLAGFIGVVYAATVAVVALLVGADVTNPAISIAATGVVALTFQPARDRVQRFANRLVYGHRSTPYEVLSRFSDRVGNTYATDDVLPRTARVIAEGVHAERATIWLNLADELRPSAGWPEIDPSHGPVPLVDDALPGIPGEHVAPITYRGDLLGAISIEKPRGEPLNPEEIRLIDDLAAQAGLVVSNVRLTADLEARLDVITRQAAELRASRQRIVAAQDEERRRLERNIHDGAQQHLVALAVKLRLSRGLLARDPEKAGTMLHETAGQIDEALETLHALALGIYPPRLEADGVAAALAARYASSDLPVRFHTDGIGRFPLDTEAAVYFCVLEALQNAAKYADAGAIEVTFAARDGALTFEVVDDGAGFDPTTLGYGTGLHGMRDRLAVLGGDVSLASAPGRGTTVRGRVPLVAEVTA
jgi:signal transduction histidine kinase